MVIKETVAKGKFAIAVAEEAMRLPSPKAIDETNKPWNLSGKSGEKTRSRRTGVRVPLSLAQGHKFFEDPVLFRWILFFAYSVLAEPLFQ